MSFSPGPSIVPMVRRCDQTIVEESCESTEEVDVLPGKSCKNVHENLEKEDGGEDSREDCVVVDIDDGDIVGDGHNESVEEIDKQRGLTKSETEKTTKEKKTSKQPRQKVSICKNQDLEKDHGGEDSNKDCADADIDDGEDSDIVNNGNNESVEEI